MSINLTLVGQIITFAIFVWFTMKFVWPPLKVALDERKKKIADGILAAEKAEEELEVAQRNSKVIVQEAKTQAATIVEQANERAHKLDESAKADARTAATRIKEAAMAEMSGEKLRLKEELKKEVAGIALAGAEKIIETNIDQKSNQKILDQLAKEI
jgi:F-type H+-transporting ATPase subunit b